MNDDRRAGEALSRAVFGMGARSNTQLSLTNTQAPTRSTRPDVFVIEGHTDAAQPPNVLDVLTPEQKATRAQKQGLGGCSCSKRKVPDGA